MKKNANKLERIITILLFIIIIIEDNGKLHFNIYVYNVQDKIIIDYVTGESNLAK